MHVDTAAAALRLAEHRDPVQAWVPAVPAQGDLADEIVRQDQVDVRPRRPVREATTVGRGEHPAHHAIGLGCRGCDPQSDGGASTAGPLGRGCHAVSIGLVDARGRPGSFSVRDDLTDSGRALARRGPTR